MLGTLSVAAEPLCLYLSGCGSFRADSGVAATQHAALQKRRRLRQLLGLLTALLCLLIGPESPPAVVGTGLQAALVIELVAAEHRSQQRRWPPAAELDRLALITAVWSLLGRQFFFVRPNPTQPKSFERCAHFVGAVRNMLHDQTRRSFPPQVQNHARADFGPALPPMC